MKYEPSVFNRGYLGEGHYKTKINGKHTKQYTVWKSMLGRCYDPKFLEKHSSYIGCSVIDSWLNFQVFAEWFDRNYIDGYVLDKDILVKNNKIYSPFTCCFIPQEINKIFTLRKSLRGNLPLGVFKFGKGYSAIIKINSIRHHLGTFDTIEKAFDVYRVKKEAQIRDVAIKYRNIISNRAFEGLIYYKIEIND